MSPKAITKRYVRKPLFVDAIQVTEDNFAEVAEWCDGEVKNSDESKVDPSAELSPTTQYIRVRVNNPKNPRQTKAYVNDWVLYSDLGYKVYSTKAFQQNFDLDEESSDDSDQKARYHQVDSDSVALSSGATDTD